MPVRAVQAVIPLDEKVRRQVHGLRGGLHQTGQKGRQLVSTISKELKILHDMQSGDPLAGDKFGHFVNATDGADRIFHSSSFFFQGTIYKALAEVCHHVNAEEDWIKFLMKAMLPMRYQGEYFKFLVTICTWMYEQGRPEVLLLEQEIDSICAVFPGKETYQYQDMSATLAKFRRGLNK